MTDACTIKSTRQERIMAVIAASMAAVAAIGMLSAHDILLIKLTFGLGLVNLLGWLSLAVALLATVVFTSVPGLRSMIRRRPGLFFGLVGCQYLFFVTFSGVGGLVSVTSSHSVIGRLKDYAFIGEITILSLFTQTAASAAMVAILVLITGRRPRGTLLSAALFGIGLVDVLFLHTFRLSSIISVLH